MICLVQTTEVSADGRLSAVSKLKRAEVRIIRGFMEASSLSECFTGDNTDNQVSQSVAVRGASGGDLLDVGVVSECHRSTCGISEQLPGEGIGESIFASDQQLFQSLLVFESLAGR
jgi:hypothetical protein